MNLTRILEILGLKRTPARIEAETISLQRIEDKTEARELLFIEDIFRHFESLKAIAFYSHSSCMRDNWIAINSEDIHKFEHSLNQIQSALLDLKGCSQTIIAIKERVLSNLLKIRRGKREMRNNYLSHSEGKLIKYAESIEEHIEYAVQQVKLLGEQDMDKLVNVKILSYLEPKNHDMGQYARAIIGDIENSLLWIRHNVSELFKLDRSLREQKQ
ncbi:hypothetical protein HYX06_01640 [Candidatus Woesearchaeota archaeon]|nr:hypothetical protein [Candidatus Woesearchaeota archaeon]